MEYVIEKILYVETAEGNRVYYDDNSPMYIPTAPACISNGNPQPSQVNSKYSSVTWKVQRLTDEDWKLIIPTRVPNT